MVSITDVKWSYCDTRCTYLQKSKPDTDFLVISFYTNSTSSGQVVAQCYAKLKEVFYTLQSKLVKNKFYQEQCGNQDYLLDNFTIAQIQGQGIGTEINY